MTLREWDVPPHVLHRWSVLHGPTVASAWRAEALTLAASCAEMWELRVDEFLPGGSLSCPLACRRADGSRAVLKLLAPWAREAIGSEARALSAWRGHGVAPLLNATPDGRALLLVRVRPGHALVPSRTDPDDCERVARLFRTLADAPTPAGLPSLSEALRIRFDRARTMQLHRPVLVDPTALDTAEQLAIELAEEADRRVSVHGDSLNKNLLVSDPDGALVAIDPMPAIGDDHFDPALWALTHRPGEGVRARCEALARLLSLDADRLWCWCLLLVLAEVALELPARANAHRRLLRL